MRPERSQSEDRLKGCSWHIKNSGLYSIQGEKLMEHQSYKMMKETWFLASKELKSNGIRKNYNTETRERHGPEEHAVGMQRKVRYVSRRKSILTVVLKVRGFVSWGK